MKNHKNGIPLLLGLLMLGALAGCALNAAADKNNDTLSSETEIAAANAAVLEEAATWFEQQTTRYEIICGEAHGDTVVFLTGTKNPGTDSYQLLQAFVVQKNDDGYAVTAMKDGYRSLSAGISAHVLATDNLTVVFGDTSDSVFDFINDRRLDVDFTEVNILLKDGEAEAREITGDAPYLLVFTDALDICDIEFVSSDLTVKYSFFYSEKLMDNAASYDVSNIFE